MSGRALVLGGGGITGIAWELGIIASLAEQGVDLSTADVVVGTSAGSVVGAQLLSGWPAADLFVEQLRDSSGERASPMRFGGLVRFLIASAWPGNGRVARAYLGHAALRARTISERDFRGVFTSMLHAKTWPDRRLLITAVDAETGRPKVFDSDSGVDLVDAVAASCAVPMVFPPMTVAGRRYVDGGVRSVTNADLAAGCDRVVVLAPVNFALKPSLRISRQLRQLGDGVRSVVVSPDSAARKAIGTSVLSPSNRAAAARAGRDQGVSVVESIRSVWSAAVTA